jgi:hypothetical protein
MAAGLVALTVSLSLAVAAAPAASRAPRLDAAGPARESSAVAPEGPRPSANQRLGLGLGIGLAGGLSWGIGLGMVLRQRQVYATPVPAPNNLDYVAAVNSTDVGSAMIGGGLGLGAAALTAGLGARDRALWAELSAGGVLAIAGVAWYVTEWQRVQRMLYDGGKDMGPVLDAALVRREAAAASFIGAGLGLSLGAGLTLLTRYLVARRVGAASRVAFGGGPFGGALIARF